VPKVDVSINGRLYGVACDEGQQPRVRELAAMVDERVKRLSSGGPVGAIGETHILVLAGLLLADELSESRAALENEERLAAARHAMGQQQPQQDEDLLVVTIDHLADRIGDIAERLDRA
jgi:cell division protein ZapA